MKAALQKLINSYLTILRQLFYWNDIDTQLFGNGKSTTQNSYEIEHLFLPQKAQRTTGFATKVQCRLHKTGLLLNLL